ECGPLQWNIGGERSKRKEERGDFDGGPNGVLGLFQSRDRSLEVTVRIVPVRQGSIIETAQNMADRRRFTNQDMAAAIYLLQQPPAGVELLSSQQVQCSVNLGAQLPADSSIVFGPAATVQTGGGHIVGP